MTSSQSQICNGDLVLKLQMGVTESVGKDCVAVIKTHFDNGPSLQVEVVSQQDLGRAETGPLLIKKELIF